MCVNYIFALLFWWPVVVLDHFISFHCFMESVARLANKLIDWLIDNKLID